MTKISIFGKGKMGAAIGRNFEDAGNEVSYIQKDSTQKELGNVVIFAVPYSAIEAIISQYRDELSGKIVIDVSNPVNFDTFDDLVVPADSSATAIIANTLPNSRVVKGFNTTFAATLASKKVADKHQTTVLLASDSQEAKEALVKILDGSGLAIIDAGQLKRARELEALGFLQIALAAGEKITWNGGFGIFN